MRAAGADADKRREGGRIGRHDESNHDPRGPVMPPGVGGRGEAGGSGGARETLLVVLALVVLAAVTALGIALRGDVSGTAQPPARSFGRALLALAGIALLGRTLLAWLPAGLPGRHAPGSLASTWAASHVLGIAALVLTRSLLAPLGLSDSIVAVAALWAILLAARVLSLPGSLVPRHELPGERPRAAHRVASLAIVCAIVALVGHVGRSASPDADPRLVATAIVSWLAAAGLVAHGLERGRRAPAPRRLLVALFVLTPSGLAASAAGRVDAVVALGFAGGCAGLVSWLRRADRRGLALALASFGTCVLVQREALPLTLAGLVALVAATARPARALAAQSALGVGGACCAAAFLAPVVAGAGAGAAAGAPASASPLVLLLPSELGVWTLALVLGLVVARRAGRAWSRDRIGLALALGLALPAELARVLWAGDATRDATGGLPLAPALALLAGSLLLRRERDEPSF